MKKLFTLLALTISFSMNAQVSTASTDAGGLYCTAMGWETIATNLASTAMGRATKWNWWTKRDGSKTNEY